MKLTTINKKRAKLIQSSPFAKSNDFKIVHVGVKTGWIQARHAEDSHIEIYNAFTKVHEVLEDLFLDLVDMHIKNKYGTAIN